MSVGSLGYIGVTVKDPAAFGAFATGVLGLMQDASASGALRFRMDEHAWRIQIEPGDVNEVAFLGFEVAGPTELDAIVKQLREGGVAVQESDAGHRAERGVLGLISCKDPEGLTVEVYYGPTLRLEAPFVSPAGVARFVTGEQGLGHIAMATKSMDETRRFFQGVLGFRLTDIIDIPMGPEAVLQLEFFHCNARHHTLALAPLPTPTRLQHIMIQVPALDDVGLAQERAVAAGAPIAATLGRHTNDRMVSFYVESPAGFQFEFGYGAIDVDDATWRVARYDRGSSWGHKRSAA
jgi:2,3-dihydroxybiphenyl 1,2-dioxygenase